METAPISNPQVENHVEENNVSTHQMVELPAQLPNEIKSDNKSGDNTDNTTPKPRPAKGKKRKKPKDSAAPKHPLTGYVRYLNDRREAVRSGNPALPFQEITKILASEWTSLAADKKRIYLDAAEIDRERYTREYNAYKLTDAYKSIANVQILNTLKKQKESLKNEQAKVPVNNVTIQPIAVTTQSNNVDKDNNSIQISKEMDFASNFDIPIFTEEFLDHNKARDSELRQLRKSNNDYEQQNAMLSKHIESMKGAIEKLETEILLQKKNNNSLQAHLERLRTTLTNGFSNVKLPGVKDVATLQTIDSYMNNLHSMLIVNSNQDSNLFRTVREIVGQLEFSG